MPFRKLLTAMMTHLLLRRDEAPATGPTTLSNSIPPRLTIIDLPSDIAYKIMTFLSDDTAALLNAMHIDLEWHNSGQCILYVYKSAYALIHAPDPLYYVPSMTELVFDLEHADRHAQMFTRWLPLDGLKRLELVIRQETFITNYFNPALEVLHLTNYNTLVPTHDGVEQYFHGESIAAWLTELGSACRRLRSLTIKFENFDVAQHVFWHFLDVATALEHLEITSPSGCLRLRPGMLRLLSQLSHCRTLRLGHVFHDKDARMLDKAAVLRDFIPFHGVEDLTIHCEPGVASILLPPFLITLRSLDITLHPDHLCCIDETAFHKIAALKNLETLTITLPNTIGEISPTALMALANLVNLRKLKVISPGKIRCDISAADLKIVAKQWNKVEVLECGVGVYLGQKEIDVFAEVCPELEIAQFATIKRGGGVKKDKRHNGDKDDKGHSEQNESCGKKDMCEKGFQLFRRPWRTAHGLKQEL